MAAVAAPTEYLSTFPVLGRSLIHDTNAQKLKLAPADRAMVQQKKALILGFSNDIPPFEITISGQDYEGLTADFASLVSQLLNIKITARRYPDRLTARAALKRGEIDILGIANNMELSTDSFLTLTENPTRSTSRCWSLESASGARLKSFSHKGV